MSNIITKEKIRKRKLYQEYSCRQTEETTVSKNYQLIHKPIKNNRYKEQSRRAYIIYIIKPSPIHSTLNMHSPPKIKNIRGYSHVTINCTNLMHYLDASGIYIVYIIQKTGVLREPPPYQKKVSPPGQSQYRFAVVFGRGKTILLIKLKHSIQRGTSSKLPEQKQPCLCSALAYYLTLPTVNQNSTEKPSLGHHFVCSRPSELPLQKSPFANRPAMPSNCGIRWHRDTLVMLLSNIVLAARLSSNQKN